MDQQPNNLHSPINDIQPESVADTPQPAPPYEVSTTITSHALVTFGKVLAIFLIVSGLPFVAASFLMPGIYSIISLMTALVPVFLGVMILVLIRLNRKRSDLNGDGLAGDLEPATEAQMILIENGFRSLGQFYVRPKRRLTQAEARETLDRIQQQVQDTKS